MKTKKSLTTTETKEMLQFIVLDMYKRWYREDVAPKLKDEQKEAVMRRISDMTLEDAIWLDHETNFIDKFPELEPYSHSKKISGMQLIAVMEGCLLDLHPEAAKVIPKLPWEF